MGRLYELIWKRMIASQMEAARIERTTIDLESADGQTGLRATGQVVIFPGYLAVYEEGRDAPEADAGAGADEADEADEGGRLPLVQAGAHARVAEALGRPAFHRAAAALFRSVPGQEDGGTGHRSAIDLCLDPYRAARPRLRSHGQGPLRAGGRRASGHRLPGTLLRPLCRIRLHRRARGAARPSSAGQLDWKTLLREFWRDFHAAVGEIAEVRMGEVLEALDLASRN